jgi:hypothetical protein
MGVLEQMAVEALKRALTQGSAAAGEQLVREVLSVLPQDRLLSFKRIVEEVIKEKTPTFTTKARTA